MNIILNIFISSVTILISCLASISKVLLLNTLEELYQGPYPAWLELHVIWDESDFD